MDRYEEFKRELKQELKQWLGSECRIEFECMVKNNGVVQNCVLIQQPGEEKGTYISLAPYWDSFQKGRMQQILSEFQSEYESGKISPPFSVEQFLDFEQMKERVVWRLVNAELNRELLAQVPYIPFLDLAITFSLQLWSGADSQFNCLIYNRHLELWGIEPEILYPLAAENTPRLLPLQFCHICDVIGHIELEEEPIEEEPKMYILSNQFGVYGAAALLYPDALKEAAKQLDADLLILPSSVHEVLVVPKAELIGELDFEEIVQVINQSEVLPEDILSNHIYQYDRKAERLTFCERKRNQGGTGYGSGTIYQ